uniref:Uncharacterized protein n=1 Tax=Ditylum brightwellii TaxID=49249 RepID=A0A6U3NIG8_9STRA|mmetsp:Transcript_8688/g.11039  ORF Transcript_8688/g.11039 Transcript_8688/m.11039 type:complete len:127 (-) Transcript_8688:45-425(-)
MTEFISLKSGTFSKSKIRCAKRIGSSCLKNPATCNNTRSVATLSSFFHAASRYVLCKNSPLPVRMRVWRNVEVCGSSAHVFFGRVKVAVRVGGHGEVIPPAVGRDEPAVCNDAEPRGEEERLCFQN